MAAEGQCSSADQAESDGSDLHGQNAGPVEPDEHDLVYVPDNAKCPEGIRSQLRAWAVKHHIRIAAVNSLLDILRPRFTDLLKTQSALVSTRQSVPQQQRTRTQHIKILSSIFSAFHRRTAPCHRQRITEVGVSGTHSERHLDYRLPAAVLDAGRLFCTLYRWCSTGGGLGSCLASSVLLALIATPLLQFPAAFHRRTAPCHRQRITEVGVSGTHIGHHDRPCNGTMVTSAREFHMGPRS
ncbi:hypothetical protein V5799_011169 [Amblyomma americanum]|uniref:Uncharacterized protein n=1 Tax=Amblyomma americanum TaxID=6943 RepID=A0AAQ4EHZ5_AMBAM